MNSILSTLRITGIAEVCMFCGGLAGANLKERVDGRFSGYYQENPILFWIAAAVNMLAIPLLFRQMRKVWIARANSPDQTERASVKHSLLSTTYTTTSFVRICIYLGLYLVGIGMCFLPAM